MKIVFYDEHSKLAYNPNTEKNVGVGGKETVLIKTAETLSSLLGHEVIVFTNCNIPNIYAGVKYYKYFDFRPQNEDIFISFGGCPHGYNVPKTKIYWNCFDNAQYILQNQWADIFIVNSEWQRDIYAKVLPPDIIKKMRVVNPGVDLELLPSNEEKWEFDISHMSHPAKGGMSVLPETFSKIKNQIPQITLHVYGGGGLWGWDNESYRGLYTKLIKSGILYHGTIAKKDLFEHLSRSKVFLYPLNNLFKESFCLSVLEAMICGCVVVAKDSGNINTLLKDGRGFVVEGDTGHYMWSIDAAEKVIKVLNNQSLFEEMSKKSKVYARQFTWEKTATMLLRTIS